MNLDKPHINRVMSMFSSSNESQWVMDMDGNHQDIPEDRESQLKNHRPAYFDAYTGLPNIEQFKLDIDSLAAETTKSIIVVSVESLYSLFNMHGQEISEGATKRVLQCLLDVFSPFQARYYSASYDKFLVLLQVPIPETGLSSKFEELLNKVDQLIKNEPRFYGLNVYLGGNQFQQQHDNPFELVRRASKACEFAKLNNQSKWVIYNKALHSKIERLFYIEKQLQPAINNQEITIHLQPIFNAKTYDICSFEALARWEHSDYGPIFPDEFIPAAERKGLISALGECVLKQACEFICTYNKKHRSQVRINVNVSVLQLLDERFPERVQKIVKQSKVKPQHVVLEITESVLLDNNHLAIDQLKLLATQGFILAMDDFGSGYSSTLGFLNLPFNQIKLDRELASQVMNTPNVASYFKYLAGLCREVGIGITVEGIESADMLKKIRCMQIGTLQGYFLSRPLSPYDALHKRFRK